MPLSQSYRWESRRSTVSQQSPPTARQWTVKEQHTATRTSRRRARQQTRMRSPKYPHCHRPPPIAGHSQSKHRCPFRQSAAAPLRAPALTTVTPRPHQPDRRTIPPDGPKEENYTTVNGGLTELRVEIRGNKSTTSFKKCSDVGRFSRIGTAKQVKNRENVGIEYFWCCFYWFKSQNDSDENIQPVLAPKKNRQRFP